MIIIYFFMLSFIFTIIVNWSYFQNYVLIIAFFRTYILFTHMRPANISKQRIMGELKKLNQQKLSYLTAAPLEDDLYTWHFTFQGPQNTQFHEGIYHGQILLPYEYPFKPPDIVFMNKNGRFETNTKICLTITQYHPQEWNSAWTVRTMLEAVISLFAENVQGVGSLTSTSDVRQFLAKTSHSYSCEKCGPIKDLLAPRPPFVAQPIQMQKVEPPVVNQKQEVKVQRKLSEDHKPKIQQINLKRNYTEDQRNFIREKYGAESQGSENIWKKEEKKPISPIFERPNEEEPIRQHNLGPEIIYIQDRLPIANHNFNLSKTVKTIQTNLIKLEHVTASLKWAN